MGMTGTARPHRLYLDTNVFIYAVQGTPELAVPLQAFLRDTRQFALRPVTSELALAELLSKPGLSPVMQRVFMNLIVYSKMIDLKPVTRDILLRSAELRRIAPKCRLADAIHAGTSADAGCTHLMTNDDRFAIIPDGVTLVKPDAFGLQLVRDALSV
jgi:predicted nucleic acid-binding protein